MEVGISARPAFSAASDIAGADDGTYGAGHAGDAPDAVIAGVGEVDIAVGVNGDVAWEVEGRLKGRGAFAREGGFAVTGDGGEHPGSTLAGSDDGSHSLIAGVGDEYLVGGVDGNT